MLYVSAWNDNICNMQFAQHLRVPTAPLPSVQAPPAAAVSFEEIPVKCVRAQAPSAHT